MNAITSDISRRGFVAASAGLAALALAAGSAAVPARASESASTDAADENSCDVLVIGGGISGTLAALSAKAEGADVILIEKQGMIGGSASLSSGFMVTVENDHFADEIDDSWDKMSSVLHATHDQSPDTTYPTWDRLTDLFEQQSATIDFMCDLGMTAEFGEKSTAVTMWDGQGAGMMEALAQAMEDKGVRVLLETPATVILTDDAGAVCGARATTDAGEVEFSAKKVVLACGGASHNDEILTDYLPTWPDIECRNLSAAGNTGDGFVMGEALGAQFYPSLVLEGGGAALDDEFKSAIDVKFSTSDKLAVDADGARFTNEGPSGSAGQMLTYYMVDHGSSSYFFLYDGTDEEQKAALETAVEMGAGYYGATVEELAEAMGADPATLADTFAAYQDACASGEDPEFGKAAENLVAYDDADGLYALHYRPTNWGTIGGIVTDDTFHALNEDGEPIENLFAVGEMSNREFFSCFYVGGNSLALNSTAGRIAGATAVAEIG